jgi:hypothetical protein
MTNKFLFPHSFKKWGWIILIPSAIAGILFLSPFGELMNVKGSVFAFLSSQLFEDDKVFTFIETNVLPTVIGALFILGALLVAFSKEKIEDEFIANIRQTSLVWAVLVNYAILFFCMLFIYGMDFLLVMVYNMFTVLVLFIIRYYYMIWYHSKKMQHEE